MPSEKSGKLPIMAEGFTVSWDVQGLEIRATEIHNKPLRLPWRIVLDLAQQARASTTEEALAILELPLAASATDIKRAHRDWVKVWRPDRFRRSARLCAKAQLKLRQINQAYQILKGHPPSPRADSQTTQPPPRQVPVGDVTQAMPLAFPEILVPEEALALLIHEGGSLSFPITSETVRIGRYDPVTGILPEIDLSQVDIRRSVSRRHARIALDGGSFLLSEETGVLNGTFINGRRSIPGESAPLRSGDRLCFGTISVVFKASQNRGAHSGRSVPRGRRTQS